METTNKTTIKETAQIFATDFDLNIKILKKEKAGKQLVVPRIICNEGEIFKFFKFNELPKYGNLFIASEKQAITLETELSIQDFGLLRYELKSKTVEEAKDEFTYTIFGKKSTNIYKFTVNIIA